MMPLILQSSPLNPAEVDAKSTSQSPPLLLTFSYIFYFWRALNKFLTLRPPSQAVLLGNPNLHSLFTSLHPLPISKLLPSSAPHLPSAG